MKQYAIDLLSKIPNGADEDSLPEELSLDEIPKEHLLAVRELLQSDDAYTVFQAARLLTCWGDDIGFNKLVRLFDNHDLYGFISHRLHGYDDTLQHVLDALISYWAVNSDKGERERAREKIFPYVAKIIEDSNTQPFQINSIFWVVNKYKYQEYIKPLEKHLEKIIDHPEIHFWKIHDVIEFFLKIDPDFVNRLLKEKGKTLKDFNFQN
ncbi:MAG: hypothetical protein E7I55_15850 [Acinetobacter ursingii]|nr:hypothetical protein [Acinetobacter ursingii]